MVKTTSHSKYCKKNKTMKKIYNLLLFTVLAAGLAACSSDEEKTDVAGPAAGNLQIIMQTPQAAGRSTAPGTSGSWHSKKPARTMSICRTFRSPA
jgi:hypothetical protein